MLLVIKQLIVQSHVCARVRTLHNPQRTDVYLASFKKMTRWQRQTNASPYYNAAMNELDSAYDSMNKMKKFAILPMYGTGTGERQKQRERDWLNWTQYSTLSHSFNLWLHKIYSTFIYTECAKITLTERDQRSYKKVWEQCVFRILRQLTKWLIVAIVGDKHTAIAKEREWYDQRFDCYVFKWIDVDEHELVADTLFLCDYSPLCPIGKVFICAPIVVKADTPIVVTIRCAPLTLCAAVAVYLYCT